MASAPISVPSPNRLSAECGPSAILTRRTRLDEVTLEEPWAVLRREMICLGEEKGVLERERGDSLGC